MKLLKITATLLCLLACFMLKPAAAQDMDKLKNSTPEKRAQFQTELMKTKLNLDSGQVLKVQAINLAYAKKMEPVLKGDGGRLSKFKQARAIQSAKEGELKAVFTPDQYKKYKAFEDEMKTKMMEKAKDMQ